jgi:WD40 repeat protein
LILYFLSCRNRQCWTGFPIGPYFVSMEINPMMVLNRSLCTAVLASLILISPAFAGEPTGPLVKYASARSWSDLSGRFQIEGTLKFADGEKVELLKEDGRVVTVPLDKLSSRDRTFIQEFLRAEAALGAEDAENPFAGGVPEENPFAGGVPSRGARSTGRPTGLANRPSRLPGRAGGVPSRNNARGNDSSELGSASTSGNAELKTVQAVVNGARPLTITPNRPFWSAKPTIPLPEISLEDTIIQSDLAKPFFAAMRAEAAGRSGTVVLNAYQQGRGGRNENYGRFAVIDSLRNDVSSVIEFDAPWKLMAISPDASLIAAVRVEGFDKGNDVAIFRIANGQVVPLFQFTAGGGSWDELHWVSFLPGNRLATISQKHNLTIWDLANKIAPKALYRGSTGGALTAEITAAGDLMAYPVGTSIAFVETSAGKLVGCITRDVKAEQLAFSPHGQYLAAFHPFTLTLYSLQDGTEVKSIAIAESNPQAKLRWCGEHLMIGSVLYDVQRALPVWTYEGRPAAQATLGSYLISAFGGDSGTTATVFRVPHEEAIRASADVDPRTIYAIVPGDGIAVEYDLAAAPPAVQQQIRQAVETKIREIGWQMAASSPNKLQVKLTQGAQEEAEYFTRTGFGPFFAPPGFGGPRPSGPSEKVQFRPWTHSLTIVADGKPVFTNNYVRTAPQTLQSKDGETTQSQVMKHVQPFPDHFKNMAIPPSLLKAEFQGGIGKSTLDATGIR